MNNILTRGPDGRFIGMGQALTAWLPALLEKAWGNELLEMLDGAAKWCLKKAAQQYGFAATCLREESARPEAAATCVKRAERWFRRREILEQARAKLEELG